ncbi:MAG: type III-B CRISPR module RAMP protein Cmr6, partial [Chitinophagales bacterium]
MSREKGTLKVSNKLAGKIKVGKKLLSIPKEYQLAPRTRFNNKECEYELDGGTVVKVFVEGKELPKDTEAEKRKEERQKREAERVERERIQKEEAKKQAALNAQYRKDSFDVKKAFCPKDTSDLNIQSYQVENFALKLNRFARFVENERDYSKSNFEFYKTHRGQVEYQIIPNYGSTNFQELTERAKKNVELLLGEENCKVFNQTTSGRLITGLGGASVYETDITLHQIYGFPYLPASGIKGVVRSWIITNAFANETDVPNNEKEQLLTNAEFRAYQNEAFCRIFGCPSKATKALFDEEGNIMKDHKGRNKTKQYDVALKDKKGKGQENQGKVQFFDAYPTDAPKVVPDVMNPHYAPYYNGDKPPADYHNPIPIFFLTVDKKTEFQFMLGSKDLEWRKWTFKNNKGEDKDILWWLQNVLQ